MHYPCAKKERKKAIISRCARVHGSLVGPELLDRGFRGFRPKERKKEKKKVAATVRTTAAVLTSPPPIIPKSKHVSNDPSLPL